MPKPALWFIRDDPIRPCANGHAVISFHLIAPEFRFLAPLRALGRTLCARLGTGARHRSPTGSGAVSRADQTSYSVGDALRFSHR